MVRRVATGAAGLGLALALGMGCSSPTDAADTDFPLIVITSPKADSTVSGLVLFSAQALDAHGIAKVRFLVDGSLLLEDLSEPYAANWNTIGAGNGPHSLRAEAVDLSGNTAFASISVTVDNSRQ